MGEEFGVVSRDFSERALDGERAIDPVSEAWRAVEADWSSTEAHRRFLAVCDSLDRLAEAGRRYRIVKETDPNRRAAAEARIEELLGLAMKRVRLDRTEPSQRRSRLEWVALGLSIVLVTAAILSALRMFPHG